MYTIIYIYISNYLYSIDIISSRSIIIISNDYLLILKAIFSGFISDALAIESKDSTYRH